MENNFKIYIEDSITNIKSSDWDSCNSKGNIFLSYNFLKLLEDSNSIGGNTGWEPVYFCLKINNEVNAIVPEGGEIDTLSKLPKAWFNLVPYREVGLMTAEYLKEKFDIPYVSRIHLLALV